MVSRKRAAKFESSVVMRFLFVGWFSATAGNYYGNISPLGQGRLTAMAIFCLFCLSHGLRRSMLITKPNGNFRPLVIMHAAIQLSVFWVLAFLSLCTALVLLNIFYALIGDGLELLSLGKEAVIAGIASLVEAASLWLVVAFVPGAARAMIFPALVVATIYKVAHFEDWGRFEVILLLVFQIVVGCLGVSLFFGQVQTAMIILVVFAAVLAVIAGISKNL